MTAAVESVERLRRFRPYPEYHDSGAAWFGQVPQTWKVRKGKWLFREVVDRNHLGEPLLSVTQANGVLPRDESELRVWNPGDDLSGYKLVLPDDFVISLRSFQGGIEHSSCRGILSPAYTVLRPKYEFDARFFRHLLKAEPVISALNAVSTGIRQGKNISFEDFGSLPYVLPPLNEQRAIAEFLDRETKKIDALVAKKERLIELLQEKRTALITHAVTKGLDPTAPTKPSGIEWLGEIPLHWEVTRLSYVSERIGDGIHATPKYVDESAYHFVNGNNLNQGRIAIKPSTRCVSLEEFRKYDLRLNSKTLLLSINGTIGNLAYFRGEKIVLGKSAAYIVLGKKIIEHFAFNVLQSSVVKRYFEEGIAGTTISNLSLESIRNTPIAVPPLDEQRQIADFLARKCGELGRLIKKSEQAIDRLKEFRTALISAAVTGKIDVREEVA